MTPKSGPPSELLEPLQNFLQSFTQELTEQQFVPAFREELRRVVSAIDNLQQSEESLQQIARGVERLREVFAPAGTRLLEGAKDLESVMRANASDLRDRSSQVIKDLLGTHDQLEAALRNEAGIIQEQTSASREALTRTVADVEQRLQTLTTTLEGLCRKMETETAQLATASGAPRRVVEDVLLTPTFSAPGTAAVGHLPDDVRTLLARTETTLNVEMERQRKDFLAALQQSAKQNEERLSRVDHSVERAISTVAPRIQEELDQAILRLEERLRSQLVSNLPAGSAAPSEGGTAGASPAAPESMSGAIASAENRLVNEIAALRKTFRGDQEAAAKSAQELAREFEEVTRSQIARVSDDTHALNESLANLNRIASALAADERQDRDQLAAMQAALQSLAPQGDNPPRDSEAARQSLELLRAQSEILARKVDEDRHLLAQLAASISRAEQAATSATDRAHTESRMLREKIDAALKELAERLQRDVVTESDRVQETLRQLAQAWQTELGGLREDIGQLTKEAGTNLAASLKQIQAHLEDTRRAEQTAHRDLQSELSRTASTLDERVVSLQTTSEAAAKELQTHVKAVSNEVAKARASQEQSLAVLKEAIRANYDEGASRLREVVENGYDNFVKQIATVPQSLERYASLIQSLNQSNQLALQSISTDTKIILDLATQKFETVLTDVGATKKIFPLLDRKLEKHSGELETIHKLQAQHGKELTEVKASVADTRQKGEAQTRELKDEMRVMERQSGEQHQAAVQSLGEIKAELTTVQQEDLPAFRREFATLLSTKFDMMETTVNDRQQSLRSEIFNHLDQEQHKNNRVYILLGLLTVFSVAVQFGFQILTHHNIIP